MRSRIPSTYILFADHQLCYSILHLVYKLLALEIFGLLVMLIFHILESNNLFSPRNLIYLYSIHIYISLYIYIYREREAECYQIII